MHTSWLILCALAIAACGSDTLAPDDAWGVGEEIDAPQTDPMEPEPEPEPAIEGCRDDFITGPVWQAIPDKPAALAESEWIATLGTSRLTLPFKDDMLPDYTEPMRELRASFEALGIEELRNDDDLFLVVAGTPEAITSLVRTSCHIQIMDLTGFQCGCAPEQCRAARSCRFYKGWANDTTAHPFSDINPMYASVMGCADDITIGGSYGGTYMTDARGVSWFMGVDDKVHSWRECRANLPAK